LKQPFGKLAQTATRSPEGGRGPRKEL